MKIIRLVLRAQPADREEEKVASKLEMNSIREDAVLQLNEAEILARLDGDCQLLADLCDLSLVELPRMIKSLAETIKTGEATAVHRAAHRLKGSLSIFGRVAHTLDLEALEEMALRQDLAQAPEILSRLEKHLDEFSAAVAALGKQSHARTDRR